MAVSTINIGASPEVRGSLKFTGANDIGPMLTITLTDVQFGPAAAMNLIGDEYGLIELEGQVLLSGGSFGTVTHPDDTLVSPNVNAYYVGTGTIEWQPAGGSVFTPLGNCQQFEFEPQVTRLPHYEHMTGIRSLDFNPVVQQGARCRIRLDEFTAANLKLYMLDMAGTWPT